MIYKGVRTCSSKNIMEWHDWLHQNHQIEKSVWLILNRNVDSNSKLTHDKAIEEALCFGWIESKTNNINDNSYYLFFSQRNPKSNWSRRHKKIAENLIAEGRMLKAGIDLIKVSKDYGSWSALENIENRIIPDDLKSKFNDQPQALSNFENFPPSSQKAILNWIYTSKKESTRKRRIEETVILAEKNIPANHQEKNLDMVY